MKSRHQRIHFEGKDYIWTGADWYEAATSLTPPSWISRELNALIEDELSAEDKSLSQVSQLIAHACQARDAGQYHRAEKLLRQALSLEPGNLAVLAVLSSVLRARGDPARALAETEAFRNASHPALLTTRAAALCDLGRWEEAKLTVGHALRIEQSEEAFNVVHRIKAARPDLYD